MKLINKLKAELARAQTNLANTTKLVEAITKLLDLLGVESSESTGDALDSWGKWLFLVREGDVDSDYRRRLIDRAQKMKKLQLLGVITKMQESP